MKVWKRTQKLCFEKLNHPMIVVFQSSQMGILSSEILGRCGRQKYASAVPKNLGVGVDFRPCSEGDFQAFKISEK